MKGQETRISQESSNCELSEINKEEKRRRVTAINTYTEFSFEVDASGPTETESKVYTRNDVNRRL